MKRYIFLLLIVALVKNSGAQQLTVSSLYDQNGNLHNAATAGAYKHGTVGASYRKMWDGIDGGPQTAILFGSGYLQNAKLGIGGYVYTDKTGPTKRTGVQVALAYHIPAGNDGSFSLGLEGRFQQFAIDKAKLQLSLGSNDPVLAGQDSRFKGDAGFGIAYTNKKFQIGASVSQLLQSKLDFYTGTLTRSEEAKLYRHYYFHGNYSWQVDMTTKIIPNFLFIYLPNAPLEFQGGFRAEHRELVWWGLNIRARQSWMLSAGLKIQKKFTIGYAFDIFNTPLSVYDKGGNGHEILMKYDFIK